MPQGNFSVNVKFDKSQMDYIESAINAAQQSVHLTALRRGLAVSILFNVVLLAVALVVIGGR